jgi:hypothetical protein
MTGISHHTQSVLRLIDQDGVSRTFYSPNWTLNLLHSTFPIAKIISMIHHAQPARYFNALCF